jgi:DNA mismatch repair protein MSH6
VQWVHKNKERYQIEVPVATARLVPKEWDLKSSTKNLKRFWSKKSENLSSRIGRAEAIKEEMEKDTARAVFAAFSDYYTAFARTVECIAELDCLLSLALISKNHANCVRPEFVSFEDNGGRALLDLRQAVHPTLYESANINGLRSGSDNTFIANDVFLGEPEHNPSRFVLVTGPNMGS